MSPGQMLQRRTPAGGGSRNGAARTFSAGVGTRATSLLLTAGLVVASLVVGWLVWSVSEWRRGRNPGYRLTGLRIVRRADGTSAGFWRCLLREICCLVLLLPTIVGCCLLAAAFLMGASPPDDLFGRSRRAPWDVLTGTDVVGGTPRRRAEPRTP